ncbi:MAG: hypothetical protein U9P71_09005 [Campylobacterota bacterium]|nr:hypothetical protein [Campylobacterota bacterium]
MTLLFKELYKMKHNFKQIQEISPKELGIRNKITIHYGIDSSNSQVALLGINQKSRILIKDVPKFEAIMTKLSNFVGYKFSKKVLILKAPICSKALKALQERNFTVMTDATV